ncbi:MAG: energy-coupling factor transporter transmembrane protein EcfT [Actinobacteria bacterium]|nr:energy-coupling factor transporter transmembrane protein EcfT [Actinomycetota bacterium]
MKKDAFASYHPIINFLFFAFVLVITMFVLHPVLLGISFVASLSYAIYLNGKKAVKFVLLGLVPLLILAVFINVAFNHEGVTILLYVNGNPITLESIQYGVAAALMFASIILWFSCFNAIMSSDKFIYLFGKTLPSLSLILSMVLRFVPRYKDQVKQISSAQKCIGKDISSGSIVDRAKNGVMILSIFITWALENAIETADSMKSRGYGLKGRTSYSMYRFDTRDKSVLLLLLAFMVCIVVALAAHVIHVIYFPLFTANSESALTIGVYILYAAICFFPLALNSKETIVWHSLRSKI